MVTIRKIDTIHDYNEFINHGNTINIVKISAEWCGPCKVLGSEITSMDLSNLSDVRFAEIDADNEDFDAVCTELNVRGVPVLAYFKDGNLIEKTAGLVKKDEILSKIETLR